MKRTLIAAIAAMTLATPATAQPPVTPDELGSVYVTVLDKATGGCWTNISEAETYLADKLKYLDYEVVEYSNNYSVIYILSGRHDGLCYGNVRVELGVFYYKMEARLVLVDSIRIFTGQPNANLLVFDTIDDLIDELSRH